MSTSIRFTLPTNETLPEGTTTDTITTNTAAQTLTNKAIVATSLEVTEDATIGDNLKSKIGGGSEYLTYEEGGETTIGVSEHYDSLTPSSGPSSYNKWYMGLYGTSPTICYTSKPWVNGAYWAVTVVFFVNSSWKQTSFDTQLPISTYPSAAFVSNPVIYNNKLYMAANGNTSAGSPGVMCEITADVNSSTGAITNVSSITMNNSIFTSGSYASNFRCVVYNHNGVLIRGYFPVFSSSVYYVLSNKSASDTWTKISFTTSLPANPTVAHWHSANRICFSSSSQVVCLDTTSSSYVGYTKTISNLPSGFSVASVSGYPSTKNGTTDLWDLCAVNSNGEACVSSDGGASWTKYTVLDTSYSFTNVGMTDASTYYASTTKDGITKHDLYKLVPITLEPGLYCSVDFYAPNITTSSDKRLKTNITQLTDETTNSIIDNIKTYSFNFVNSPEDLHYGVIAQELQTIAPELVKMDTTPNRFLSVNYIELIPLLINKVKQLEDEINKLKAINE